MTHETSTRRREILTLAATAAALMTVPQRGFAQTPTTPNAKFKRGYVDGPFGQIHYRYVRPGASTLTPLVCLHASPLSGIVYETWIEEMGRDRPAFAPDTPGYGSSDTPPSPPQIPDFARAIARFLDEMKIARADVMGYHTGSFTAVDLAKTYPERVRKVVLISAPIFSETELASRRPTMLRPAPSFEQMLESTLNNVRKNGKGMFTDVPTDDRYWDISLERMRHYRTSTWGFAAAFNYNLAEAIAQVKQPILVLNPQDDLWEQTPRAKPYLNARSRIHDLPGRTHGMMDSHAPEIAKVVRGFLDVA
ncbi:MAG: alpha/beta hydrolase [Rhodospirillaceae bacterium]|nr:alpha/beta hydrolase [Rhodospirillaceae bacterium]